MHGILRGCLTVLFVMLIGVTNRASAEERPLYWAADLAGGEPYVFQDPRDATRIVGFESDLRFLLAREIGRPIVFRQYPFDNLLQGLGRHDFDFAMNGLEITEERRKQVRFTRPYYVYQQGLVARKGEDRFRSLDELASQKGLKVGTLRGSIAEEILDEKKIPKAAFESQDQIYLDLVAKRIDAVYLDTVIQKAYLKKEAFADLREVGEPSEKGHYGIAVVKGNKALANELNCALNHLIENGELRRLYEKWGLWNDDQEELKNPPSFEDESEVAEEVSGWNLGRYLPLLLAGALMTVKLSVLSFALAIVLGLIVALMRMYGPAPIRALATTYIEFFRGIPVLLLLLFLYFALPNIFNSIGLAEWGKLDAFYAAVLGLGINYAAYEAEIYRAAISSVSAGQWEAATALGMSRPLTFRRIILPQAIKIILPPMTSDFIALFKDTSIVSMIAVVELMNQYQVIAKQSMKYLEVSLLTAALYLIMSVPLGYLSRYLEKRWGHAHGLTQFAETQWANTTPSSR